MRQMRLRSVLATSLAAGIAAACGAAPAGAAVPHVVQPGETLWSIAAANNLTTRTVAAFNGLSEDSQVVLGQTVQVPTTVEGYAALVNAGLAPADPAQPAAAPATPAPDGTGAETTGTPVQATTATVSTGPAPQGHYKVRPGDTLGALAGSSGVSVDAMAAMNGIDPSAPLLVGTVLKLPERRARPAAGLDARARADRRAAGRPGPDGRGRRRRRRPVGRLAARGLPLARGRDRVAGERLQQLDGLLGERARRDAGHAGHVELRAGEPRRPRAGPQLRHGQRPRRRALPQAPAQRHRRRRVRRRSPATTRAWPPCSRAACSTTRSSTSPTCRRCAPASAADPSLQDSASHRPLRPAGAGGARSAPGARPSATPRRG